MSEDSELKSSSNPRLAEPCGRTCRTRMQHALPCSLLLSDCKCLFTHQRGRGSEILTYANFLHHRETRL